jgi:hypothetical protein
MKDFLPGPSAPQPLPSTAASDPAKPPAEPPKLPPAPPRVAEVYEAMDVIPVDPEELMDAIPVEEEPEVLEVIPVDSESAASGLRYDPAAQIEKLAGLLEKGLITRREFEETKRKLLDQI